MPRRDYLKECNDRAIPLDDFKMAFCDRCLQPECTRSTHGSSKFDQRVGTWKERLITEVPRMAQDDPRFEKIAQQGFVPVQESLTLSSGWGPSDPVVEVPEAEVEPAPEIVPAPPPEVVISESSEVDEGPIHFQPQAQPEAGSKNIPRDVLLMNTDNRGELYLPGAPKSQASGGPVKKKVDSWGAPEQSHASEVIVERGATVRFGSGSGVNNR
jgi:hypothetical protein